MYSFESSGSRKPLHAMVMGAFAAAVILFSVSNGEGMAFPYLYQLGAVVCLTVGVYLLARYSLKLYRYAIEPNGVVDEGGVEQCDLVVTEIVGKRMTVVSRIGLRDIDRAAVTVIRHVDGDDAREARALLCQGKRVFKYMNTPTFPAACYIPIPEENSVVVIPVDERMVEILKEK